MKKFRDMRTRANFMKIKPGNTIVVYDTETTGLDRTGLDEIIQFAGIKYVVNKDGSWDQIDYLNKFIKPHKLIPQEVSDINHITNEKVADEKSLEELFPEIKRVMEADFWCGHNILGFDNQFMRIAYEEMCQELPDGYYNSLDTLDAVVDLVEHKECKKYNLGSMCQYFNIEESTEGTEGFHDALYDVRQTAALCKTVLKMYQEDTDIPDEGYVNPTIVPKVFSIKPWKSFPKAYTTGNYYFINTDCGSFKYDRYEQTWDKSKAYRPVSIQKVIEAVYEQFNLKSDSDLLFWETNNKT